MQPVPEALQTVECCNRCISDFLKKEKKFSFSIVCGLYSMNPFELNITSTKKS